jgi:hypothetical protein
MGGAAAPVRRDRAPPDCQPPPQVGRRHLDLGHDEIGDTVGEIASSDEDDFLVAPPYGTHARWLRNVLAAGSATLESGAAPVRRSLQLAGRGAHDNRNGCCCKFERSVLWGQGAGRCPNPRRVRDFASMSTSKALRATSDALMRDLAALSGLEAEKRTLSLDDPRLVEIAREVEAIAARILSGSRRQSALAREGVGPNEGAASINDVSRPIAAILAEWREVERQAADATPGSAQAAQLEVIATRLREEYREAFDRASRSGSQPRALRGVR